MNSNASARWCSSERSTGSPAVVIDLPEVEQQSVPPAAPQALREGSIATARARSSRPVLDGVTDPFEHVVQRPVDRHARDVARGDAGASRRRSRENTTGRPSAVRTRSSDDRRIARRTRSRPRPPVRTRPSVCTALCIVPATHAGRSDGLGDAEVHVEVVPEPRSSGRVGPRAARPGHEPVLLEGERAELPAVDYRSARARHLVHVRRRGPGDVPDDAGWPRACRRVTTRTAMSLRSRRPDARRTHSVTPPSIWRRNTIRRTCRRDAGCDQRQLQRRPAADTGQPRATDAR